MKIPQPQMSTSNSCFKVLNIAKNIGKVSNAIDFALTFNF